VRQSVAAMPPAHRLHRLATAAAVLDVSIKTVRRLIEREEIVAHRVGRSLRISEPELRRYLARCQQDRVM